MTTQATCTIETCEYAPERFLVSLEFPGLSHATLMAKANRLQSHSFYDGREEEEWALFEADHPEDLWLTVQGSTVKFYGDYTAQDPEDYLDGSIRQTRMSLNDHLAVVSLAKKLLQA